MARPIDECLDSGRLPFENRLYRTVLPVGDPAGHLTGPSLASTAVPKEHTLHTPVSNHSATDHGTSVDQLPGKSSWRVSVLSSTAPRDETNGQSCWLAHSSL
jgi:hypothetical protein